MAYTISFAKPKTENGGWKEDQIVSKMRQAARSEGWALSAGFKEWAKETYNATLRQGKHDDWTSITFKTEHDFTRFKDHFGVQ